MAVNTHYSVFPAVPSQVFLCSLRLNEVQIQSTLKADHHKNLRRNQSVWNVEAQLIPKEKEK
jgi:hypothetical protein